MSVRAAVLVSGGGPNLQALIDASQAGTLKSAAIATVLSNQPRASAARRGRRDSHSNAHHGSNPRAPHRRNTPPTRPPPAPHTTHHLIIHSPIHL